MTSKPDYFYNLAIFINSYKEKVSFDMAFHTAFVIPLQFMWKKCIRYLKSHTSISNTSYNFCIFISFLDLYK